MNIYIIANPTAGGNKSSERLSALIRACEQRGHRVCLYMTGRSGDATRAASAVDPDVDRLVVAGGDGTVNDVVNGLKDPFGLPMAILPIGTSNVLARELGLPRDPEVVARMLEGDAIRRIAVGMVNTRRFVLFVSVGFEALVTQGVRRKKGRRLGFRCYPLPVWRALRRYRHSPLRVSVPGGLSFIGGMALISLVDRFWGPFRFSPGAGCGSGALRVGVARDKNRLEVLARYSSPLFGRTECWTTVLSQAQEVVVECLSPAPVQVDGDYMGMTPVFAHTTPSRLPVLTTKR